MTDEQFEEMMEEVIAKLDENPGGCTYRLQQLAERCRVFAMTPHEIERTARELKQISNDIAESLQFIRITMKYTMFDLEATRRELEDQR